MGSDDNKGSAPGWQLTVAYSIWTAIVYFSFGLYMLILFSTYLFNRYRLSKSSTSNSTIPSKRKRWSNLSTTLALACYYGVSVVSVLNSVNDLSDNPPSAQWMSCGGKHPVHLHPARARTRLDRTVHTNHERTFSRQFTRAQSKNTPFASVPPFVQHS